MLTTKMSPYFRIYADELILDLQVMAVDLWHTSVTETHRIAHRHILSWRVAR